MTRHESAGQTPFSESGCGTIRTAPTEALAHLNRSLTTDPLYRKGADRHYA